jgi:hypothetical protein
MDRYGCPYAGEALLIRLWARGIGRFEVSSSGALLERGLFDGSVWPRDHDLDPLDGTVRSGNDRAARGRLACIAAVCDLPAIALDGAAGSAGIRALRTRIDVEPRSHHTLASRGNLVTPGFDGPL